MSGNFGGAQQSLANASTAMLRQNEKVVHVHERPGREGREADETSRNAHRDVVYERQEHERRQVGL